MSDDDFEIHFEPDPELKDALKTLEKAENDIFLVREHLIKAKKLLEEEQSKNAFTLTYLSELQKIAKEKENGDT
tara:strand:- start:230 stop:451 length:222 start_codon:yes stop_codon:yes gene_type:complete